MIEIPTPMKHWPAPAPALPAYWWTYAGTVGESCHILAHETREAMEWHYTCARSIGGNFNRLGHTLSAMPEKQIREHLAATYPVVHTVHPGTVRPLARIADNVLRA